MEALKILLIATPKNSSKTKINIYQQFPPQKLNPRYEFLISVPRCEFLPTNSPGWIQNPEPRCEFLTKKNFARWKEN